MGRRVDPDRVRAAQVVGSARALLDALDRDPERTRDLRQGWPELAERLDRLAEVTGSSSTSPPPPR